MADIGLTQRVEWIGEFWTPSHPQNPVAGTLIFDPANGARLTLVGSLSSSPSESRSDDLTRTLGSQIPVLHGTSTNGDLTLFENRVQQLKHSSGDLTTEVLYTDTIVGVLEV